MYDGLSDKSVIKPGSEVVDIIDSEDSVKAVLADGTHEEGDLVLGVDGVHSLVRRLMWRNANTSVPGTITAQEKKSLYADYTLLLGFSKTTADMSQSDLTATHHDGKSYLVIGGKEYTFWFVFFKIKRTHWPAMKRWTQADAEKYAASCMDNPISETQVFGELWKTAVRYELVNVEEGLFKHMFFGRIVLAGDAVHKMTPNVGLGGNSAMESVVVLTNLLHKAVKEHPYGKPDRAALQKLLTEYQTKRRTRVQEVIDFSKLATKMQAWETTWYKVLSRVVPFLPDDSFAKQASALFKAAPKLDFVPVPGNPQGTVKWDDEVAETQTEKANSRPTSGTKAGSIVSWTTAPLLSMCVLVSFFYMVQGAKVMGGSQTAANV
ncbi:MAG: hypothetical protein M1822_005686 [Bathelium mastoideum]|nr:MAG: hypothetical protein M1822_005686 [Bathelium mastoideum]